MDKADRSKRNKNIDIKIKIYRYLGSYKDTQIKCVPAKTTVLVVIHKTIKNFLPYAVFCADGINKVRKALWVILHAVSSCNHGY